MFCRTTATIKASYDYSIMNVDHKMLSTNTKHTHKLKEMKQNLFTANITPAHDEHNINLNIQHILLLSLFLQAS